MSIKNVKALQALKTKLESYTWRIDSIIGCMRYSLKRNNCLEPQQLSVEEDELLANALSGDHTVSMFPESAGRVIRKIVLCRLDLVIQREARRAKDEAQTVLDILNEGDE